MIRSQRAAQIWPLLALAARNRQTLTYTMVSKLTGLKAPGIGKALFLIQYYCEAKRLPQLTALVVKEKTGIPGEGLPMTATEFLRAVQKVFSHDWLTTLTPSDVELEQHARANER
jgi:hypothetical protein